MAAVDRLAGAGNRRRSVLRRLPHEVGSVDKVVRRRPPGRAVAVADTFTARTGSGRGHVTSGRDVLHVVAVGRVMSPGISSARSPLPNNREQAKLRQHYSIPVRLN